MSKKFKKTMSLIIAVCLVCALTCGLAAAEGEPELTEPAHSDVQIYVDDLLACRGYLIDGETYVTLRAMCNAAGQNVDVVWGTEIEKDGSETYTMTAQINGVNIYYTLGDNYLSANGRYIYLPQGSYELDGEILFPIDIVAKLFTLNLEKSEDGSFIMISTAGLEMIQSGDEFYNPEDLDLLAHIIHAEAGNQSLEGMIGVGAVIMNRVANPVFPDNIYDVVYAEGQFEPTWSGSINLEPNELSIVAAYLTLEGYNTVEDSVSFYNPGSGTGYLTSPTFVTRIEDHVFFRR